MNDNTLKDRVGMIIRSKSRVRMMLVVFIIRQMTKSDHGFTYLPNPTKQINQLLDPTTVVFQIGILVTLELKNRLGF